MSKKARLNREKQVAEEASGADQKLPSVWVSTPSLDGNMTWGYTKSVLDIQRACNKFGLKFGWRIVWGMSILPLARNRIVSQFMSTGYDFLVMLDGDIEVNAQDIMAAVLSGKQFVGLPCSKRAPNFKRMQDFVISAGPDVPSEYLSSYLSTPNFVVNEDSTSNLDEVAKDLNLVRAEKVGTGCVILHRSVFEKLQEAYPGRVYLEPNGETEEDRKKNAPTQTFEYFRYSSDDEGFFIGEDFTFCHDWTNAGGEIWMKVDAITRHYGTIHFTWDAAALQPIANAADDEEQT
jgi:hypothetical protein